MHLLIKEILKSNVCFQVEAIYKDFAKAFESVNHVALIEKLIFFI